MEMFHVCWILWLAVLCGGRDIIFGVESTVAEMLAVLLQLWAAL